MENKKILFISYSDPGFFISQTSGILDTSEKIQSRFVLYSSHDSRQRFSGNIEISGFNNLEPNFILPKAIYSLKKIISDSDTVIAGYGNIPDMETGNMMKLDGENFVFGEINIWLATENKKKIGYLFKNNSYIKNIEWYSKVFKAHNIYKYITSDIGLFCLLSERGVNVKFVPPLLYPGMYDTANKQNKVFYNGPLKIETAYSDEFKDGYQKYIETKTSCSYSFYTNLISDDFRIFEDIQTLNYPIILDTEINRELFKKIFSQITEIENLPVIFVKENDINSFFKKLSIDKSYNIYITGMESVRDKFNLIDFSRYFVEDF